jgi:putative ABC transport system substrate-binding protein
VRTHGFVEEILAWKPDVIVTTSTPTTTAVKRETRTTPIVFTVVSDPIGEGFVQSFARPGGNVTGFVNFEPSLASKWLALVKEIDPAVMRVAGLFNPDTAPDGGSYFYRAFEAAARNWRSHQSLIPFGVITKLKRPLQRLPTNGVRVLLSWLTALWRCIVQR